MNPRRLLKLLATRWWLVIIVSLAGLATAYFVAERRNDQIQPNYEATAPVLLLKTNSESEDGYEARLRGVEAAARVILTPQLTDTDAYQMRANVGLGRLEFIARAPEPAEAVRLAEGLRGIYQVAEPTGDIATELREQLDAAAIQIITLRAERGTLTEGTPLDPGVAAELALMEAQLSSLRQQAAALSLAVEFSELGTALDEDGLPRPVLDVQIELGTVRAIISRLETQYERLRATNPTVELPDETENLDLLVLDQKIRQAEALYIDTSLDLEELLGGTSTSVFVSETGVIDVTEVPISRRRAGGLGLALGAALALAALIGADRMRRPVLGIEDDLALPIRGTVSPSRPGAEAGLPWYLDGAGPRRGEIQALRAALDGSVAGGAVSIGLSGLGASDSAVQELAADLAASIAASDRRVMLVDTVFAMPSRLPEYGTAGASLADIVTYRAESGDPTGDLKLLVGDRDEVLPQLIAVHAGELSVDPVDLLAGRRFRELLRVAADIVEVIVVAAPQWGDAATDVLKQRLDHVVLVGRPRRTTAVDVEEAAADLSNRRAHASGLVLLKPRRWQSFKSWLELRRPRNGPPSRRVPVELVLEPDLAATVTESSDSDLAIQGALSRVRAFGKRSYGAAKSGRWLRFLRAVKPTDGAANDEMQSPVGAGPEAEIDVSFLDEQPSANEFSVEILQSEAEIADSLDIEDLDVELEVEPGADAPAGSTDLSRSSGALTSHFADDDAGGQLTGPDDVDETDETVSHDAPSPETAASRPALPDSSVESDVRPSRSIGSWIRRGTRVEAFGQPETPEPTPPQRSTVAASPETGAAAGEAFLIERLAKLVAHGIEGPHQPGHPYGTLLMIPDRLNESAAAILYRSVFEETSQWPVDLEESLRQAIGIEASLNVRADVVASIDWWFRVVGVEPQNASREDLISALDWWLRRRMVIAQSMAMDEPTIWYVSSRLGTFQALVHAPTFDGNRALTLRAAGVRGLLERLRLDQWSVGRTIIDGATSLEAQVKDVEDFDIALHGLSKGSAGVPFTVKQLEDAGVLASGHRDES